MATDRPDPTELNGRLIHAQHMANWSPLGDALASVDERVTFPPALIPPSTNVKRDTRHPIEAR